MLAENGGIDTPRFCKPRFIIGCCAAAPWLEKMGSQTVEETIMNSSLILYTIQGSCSDAVVALCAHLGLRADLRERKLHAEALAQVNPERCVPTLVMGDGLVLTETLAILNHLARLHAAELLGRGPLERARNEELLSYLATSVYEAFLRYFRPDRGADSQEAQAAIRQKAISSIAKVLDTREARISGKNFAISKTPATSDFFLLVFCNWANRIDGELLRAHHARMQAMPFHSLAFDANAT